MFFAKNLSKNSEITHCFFSRKNGVSKNIYKSLNSGLGSEDKKNNINKNLRIISKKIGCDYKDIITMKQTHSKKIIFIGKGKSNKKKFICDALLTNKKKICISVLAADCVPILLYDPQQNIIGVIHAGWKGLYKGIIHKTIEKLFKLGVKKTNLIVAIGPSISQRNYEVNKIFFDKFFYKSKFNKKFFKIKNTKYFFNLRKYTEYQFKLKSIRNIEQVNYDTFTDNKNFFSYRRSLFDNHKDYGRNISVIMIN